MRVAHTALGATVVFHSTLFSSAAVLGRQAASGLLPSLPLPPLPTPLQPIMSAVRILGDCLTSYTSYVNLVDLSASSLLACAGTAVQQASDVRWGTQFQKDAALVAIPATSQDVAKIVKALNKATDYVDWSFVSGGHSKLYAHHSEPLNMGTKFAMLTQAKSTRRLRTALWSILGG